MAPASQPKTKDATIPMKNSDSGISVRIIELTSRPCNNVLKNDMVPDEPANNMNMAHPRYRIAHAVPTAIPNFRILSAFMIVRFSFYVKTLLLALL